MTSIPADRLATAYKDAINAIYKRPWYSILLAIIGLLLLPFSWPVGLAVLGGAAVVASYDYKIKKRAGCLIYSDKLAESHYSAWCDLFAQLQRASKIWRVKALVPTEARKNAGYSIETKRQEGVVKKSIPQGFWLKEQLWILEWVDYQLYLLPKYFLILQDSVYRLELISKCIVSLSLYSLPETNELPPDANVLFRKCKFINLNGKCNGVLTHNPELPIVEYAWIRFTFPDLSELNFLVSDVKEAERFVDGIHKITAEILSKEQKLKIVECSKQNRFFSYLYQQLKDMAATGRYIPTSEVAALFNIDSVCVTAAGSVFERDGFRFIRTNQKQGKQHTWQVEIIDNLNLPTDNPVHTAVPTQLPLPGFE